MPTLSLLHLPPFKLDDPWLTQSVVYGNGGADWYDKPTKVTGSDDLGPQANKLLYARVWEWDEIQNIFIPNNEDFKDSASGIIEAYGDIKNAPINKKVGDDKRPVFRELKSVPGVYYAFRTDYMQAILKDPEYYNYGSFDIMFFTANNDGDVTPIDIPKGFNLKIESQGASGVGTGGWIDQAGQLRKF